MGIGSNSKYETARAQSWEDFGRMRCRSEEQLNALIRNGGFSELIRMNEVLHETQLAQIAQGISAQNAQLVLVAGPSASGKTTTANRLCTHLRLFGKNPVMISLDDYYIDRDKIVRAPDGSVDLEHIDTIDTLLFSKQMQRMLQGWKVQLPRFDFMTGKRLWREDFLQIDGDTVLIIEGLHGLNPRLMPAMIPANAVFRLYVTPLLDIQGAAFLRLLRRILRDYRVRAAAVSQTIAMWDSVRQGEKRWIFPFQEQADAIFNSATAYELPVLKHKLVPILHAVTREDPAYEKVCDILDRLSTIAQVDAETEIPPTSILREFIGGNSYFR